MSDLSDILLPETVLADVVVSNRKALFAQLGQLSNATWGFDAREITDLLARREKLVSTGCGGGIAIPHARPDSCERVVGAFLRLDSPIDFGAIDDLPVDLVFMLLSPPRSGAGHLKALARVSRLLRDPHTTEKLRGAQTRDALYAVLAGLEARDAA